MKCGSTVCFYGHPLVPSRWEKVFLTVNVEPTLICAGLSGLTEWQTSVCPVSISANTFGAYTPKPFLFLCLLKMAFRIQLCVLLRGEILVPTPLSPFSVLFSQFDDNAEFRQREIFAAEDTSESDPREVEAASHNLNYIGMDGNIGCLGERLLRGIGPTAVLPSSLMPLLCSL